MNVKPETAARLAELHAALAEVYRGLALADPAGPESDRVVGLAEAATRLGAKRSWLRRPANYKKVGGYRGADRRIHFPLSALASYLNVQKR